ncbi:MAG: chemotaxis protein CheW [Polyangiaceae bacterium]
MTLDSTERGGRSRVRSNGVLVRVGGALKFLPASVVVCIAHTPRITPVPGAPAELLGVTLHDGMVVPVVAIGSLLREMIICHHAGESLGLLGGEVVHAGSFDAFPARPDEIEYAEQRVDALDLVAICARIQPGIANK